MSRANPAQASTHIDADHRTLADIIRPVMTGTARRPCITEVAHN